MGSSASSGNNRPQPTLPRTRSILKQQIRCPVCRYNPRLIRHTELLQYRHSSLHHRIIAAAAHHNANQRSRTHISSLHIPSAHFFSSTEVKAKKPAALPKPSKPQVVSHDYDLLHTFRP